jgi:hypothetical protein
MAYSEKSNCARQRWQIEASEAPGVRVARALPLFPTRPKSAMFPPIVRLKAPRNLPMVGSNRG